MTSPCFYACSSPPDATPDGGIADAAVLDAPEAADAAGLDAADGASVDAALADAAFGDAASADAASDDAAGPVGPICTQTERWIAYRGDQDVDQLAELFAVRVTDGPSSPAQKVSAPLEVPSEVWSFAWSPDETKLAYLAHINNLPEKLYVVDMSQSVAGGAMVANGYIEDDGGIGGYSWSPDSTRLAYVADQSGEGPAQLFVVDVSGAEPGVAQPASDATMRLEGGGWGEPSFFWSPNGTMLLYLAAPLVEGPAELYVTDVSGTVPWTPVRVSGDLVSGGMVERKFRWSPDGTKILYTACQTAPGIQELFLVRVAGASFEPAVKVSHGEVDFFFDFGRAWSPDSTKVAYFGEYERLWVVDVSTDPPSDPLMVSGAAPLELPDSFAWAPDSTMIVFLSTIVGVGYSLYLAPTEGPNVGILTSLTDTVAGGGGPRSDFRWSSGAQLLAFRVDRETPGELELYVVDASTYPPALAQKVNSQLPVGGDVTETFEWSFDGQRLAYLVDQNEYQTWELYVAEIVDGVVQPAQRVNDSLPPLSDVDRFDWSPDGTRLVYVADQDTADAYEAYVVDVSAPEPWSAVKINDILQDEDSDVFEARWGNCLPN